jgi:hypothetical protein
MPIASDAAHKNQKLRNLANFSVLGGANQDLQGPIGPSVRKNLGKFCWYLFTPPARYAGHDPEAHLRNFNFFHGSADWGDERTP